MHFRGKPDDHVFVPHIFVSALSDKRDPCIGNRSITIDDKPGDCRSIVLSIAFFGGLGCWRWEYPTWLGGGQLARCSRMRYCFMVCQVVLPVVVWSQSCFPFSTRA